MNNIRKIHPGLIIKENIDEMKISTAEFSNRSGICEKTLVDIINGCENITYDIATKLSLFFDSSIEFWMNLQKQYDVSQNKI